MADPITRQEIYLAYIAGEYSGELPTPVTREEQYLYNIAVNGTGSTVEVTQIKETGEKIATITVDGEATDIYASAGGGGGGAVDTVNGKTGDVVLTASDVGALPDDTAIPVKTSDLTNDSNFVSDTNYVHTDYNYDATAKGIVDGVTAALADKVDKVSGKGLSENDYTDADKAIVGGVTTALAGKVDTSSVGAASGVAELDSNGKVPSSQLPSYVDDVIEGYLYEGKWYSDASHTTEVTGETGKIYVEVSTEKCYRWSGSAFVEISESLALGETSSTAYAGNKGKANADAITAIKDGTTIDSFGDVETELANKLGYKTTTETNADNVTENGIYIVNTSDTTNLPTTDVSMGYLLEVRRYGVFAGAIVEQIAYRGNPTTESPMYMRRWFANAWTSWVAIAKKDDIAAKADKVTSATNGNFAGLDANGNLTDSGKKASDFASSAIMDGQSVDSFGDVETALGNKQNKTLDTPLTIGGVSQSTVEGALGGLNSNLVKCCRQLTSMGDNGGSVSYHKLSIVGVSRPINNTFFLSSRYGEFWVLGSTFASSISKSVRARRVQTGVNKITEIKTVFSNDGKALDIYLKMAAYCTLLKVVAVDDAIAELSATIVTVTSSDYDAVTSDGSFDYALSTSDTTSTVTSGSTAPITSEGVYTALQDKVDKGTEGTAEANSLIVHYGTKWIKQGKIVNVMTRFETEETTPNTNQRIMWGFPAPWTDGTGGETQEKTFSTIIIYCTTDGNYYDAHLDYQGEMFTKVKLPANSKFRCCFNYISAEY